MKKDIYIENDQEKEIDLDDQKQMDRIGIKVVRDEEESLPNHHSGWKSKVMGITPLVVTVTYLFFGFTEGLWHPLWVLFLLIPLMSTILFSKKLLSMSLIVLVVILSYLLMGFLWNLWHPGWLVFFVIPIAGVIIGDADKKHRWRD